MKIEWTEPAVADLAGIRDYIARDSEFYAGRIVGRIIEAVEKLASFPEIESQKPRTRRGAGDPVPELPNHLSLVDGKGSDRCGYSRQQGPIWARAQALGSLLIGMPMRKLVRR